MSRGNRRLNPNTRRSQETRTPHAGRIVIFCEGETEKGYFDAIRELIKEDRYNSLTIKSISTEGGDARAVFKAAKKILARESKYSTYDKYLVFDCDKPEDIGSAICEMERETSFRLLYSNLCFEVWLLLHFDTASKIKPCSIQRQICKAIGDYEYHKSAASARKVIEKAGIKGLREAVRNAKALSQKYERINCRDIKQMMPYTNVYTLVEQLMKAIDE